MYFITRHIIHENSHLTLCTIAKVTGTEKEEETENECSSDDNSDKNLSFSAITEVAKGNYFATGNFILLLVLMNLMFWFRKKNRIEKNQPMCL